MGLRNTIALPGMLTTSGSGYSQVRNLMDASNFAQNLTVERSDLCGGVIGRGGVILLSIVSSILDTR